MILDLYVHNLYSFQLKQQIQWTLQGKSGLNDTLGETGGLAGVSMQTLKISVLI